MSHTECLNVYSSIPVCFNNVLTLTVQLCHICVILGLFFLRLHAVLYFHVSRLLLATEVMLRLLDLRVREGGLQAPSFPQQNAAMQADGMQQLAWLKWVSAGVGLGAYAGDTGCSNLTICDVKMNYGGGICPQRPLLTGQHVLHAHRCYYYVYPPKALHPQCL